MSAPVPAHPGDQARGRSVHLLLFRREAPGLRGGPRVGSKPSGRNAMS